MNEDLRQLLPARRGHFQLESGHHGELWLDCDALFNKPKAVEPFAADLARRIVPHKIDAVCGPLTGGAFLSLLIAHEIDVPFLYTDRLPGPIYRLPAALRNVVRNKRIAVIDDVINAGSAARATCAEIERSGGVIAVLGALLTLGPGAIELASTLHVPMEMLSSEPNKIWRPEQCPLCAADVPLDNDQR